MQKQIPLCLLAIVLSVSLFGQNLKADKIILPDSDLTNLYQIDSGVYRSEQPSKEGFKALEKYGIEKYLIYETDIVMMTKQKEQVIKLHRVKTKAHSISERQLIQALRIIRIVKRLLFFIVTTAQTVQGLFVRFIVSFFQNVSKKMQSMK